MKKIIIAFTAAATIFALRVGGNVAGHAVYDGQKNTPSNHVEKPALKVSKGDCSEKLPQTFDESEAIGSLRNGGCYWIKDKNGHKRNVTYSF